MNEDNSNCGKEHGTSLKTKIDIFCKDAVGEIIKIKPLMSMIAIIFMYNFDFLPSSKTFEKISE